MAIQDLSSLEKNVFLDEFSYFEQFRAERLKRYSNYSHGEIANFLKGDETKFNYSQYLNDSNSCYEDEILAFIRLNDIHTRLGFKRSIDAFNYLINDDKPYLGKIRLTKPEQQKLDRTISELIELSLFDCICFTLSEDGFLD